MSRPEPILIGFFPKKTSHDVSWLCVPHVEEICSVSNCMSRAPKDWIQHWKHNMTWWLYDSEKEAWEITGDEGEAYDMYAYRLFPVVFDGAEEHPIEVITTAKGSLTDYVFMGFDAVSKEGNVPEFLCSPLSCNRGADTYRVNRFCLMEELEEAWRITREIARDAKEKGSWEPGRYYLVEVYRKSIRMR